MSCHAFVTVCCDRCYTHTIPFHTAAEALNAVVAEGWIHDENDDDTTCATCVAEASAGVS